MRNLIVFNLIIMLVIDIEAQPQKENDFRSDFVSKFPQMEFPVKTKNFNNYETYRKIAAKVNQLNADVCATYFFNGDRSKVRSEFESFNMETGASLGKKIDEFDFYPAFKVESKQYLLLCFLKITLTSYEYHLAVFKHGEKKASDVLEINKVNEELSPDFNEFAAIEKSLRVQIFRFEQNPNFWKQKRRNSPDEVPKTLTTYSQFSLVNGKFKLNTNKMSYNFCAVSEIVGEKTECLAHEPLWLRYQEIKK